MTSATAWLRRRPAGPATAAAGQVTSLELFFDLVFVFTVTQLTALLGQVDGWAGAGQATLLLVLLWWMYGGYAWLTNAAPPVTPRRRGLLLLGMTANFVTALAIPHATGADRWTFAIGYLVVVGVHAFVYLTEAARVTAGMVVQLLGWNLIAAVLVVLGAALGGRALYVCWVAAVLVEVVVSRLAGFTPLRRLDGGQGPGFGVAPAHFVERHGLMLLIVLGESVLAIGVGLSAGADAIGPGQVVFAAVSLALAAVLYAAYFGTGEDHRAERALERAPASRQHVIALTSYGYALFVMLLSVVFTAAGLHHALAHPTGTLDLARGAHLAGGVAGFWVGLALFRVALGDRDVLVRLAGGLLVLPGIWLATSVSAMAALLLLLAGSSALLLLETRGRSPG
ncbi:MAG TPA: low temperature requirement protein A [Dermatophilaceae bacterium]|nr:low temperature requirement protein A [Dermatophilaceae bacterium]